MKNQVEQTMKNVGKLALSRIQQRNQQLNMKIWLIAAVNVGWTFRKKNFNMIKAQGV